MEFWSDGILGKNWIAEYHPYNIAHRDMIIFLGKVIGQKQIRSGVQNIVTTLICPGMLFPLLQYSNTPVLFS